MPATPYPGVGASAPGKWRGHRRHRRPSQQTPPGNGGAMNMGLMELLNKLFGSQNSAGGAPGIAPPFGSMFGGQGGRGSFPGFFGDFAPNQYNPAFAGISARGASADPAVSQGLGLPPFAPRDTGGARNPTQNINIPKGMHYGAASLGSRYGSPR